MLELLLIVCVCFVIYEIILDNYYKKDLKDERLISYFSNTRMQLMKMLYMKEITHDSYYFNFMIRATSYSIRTIYYKKRKLSNEQISCLESMFKFLDTENLKQEFANLNSEQRELFARTALKIVELYFNRKLRTKLLWKLYILKMGTKILKHVVTFLSKILESKKDADIISLRNIEQSYNLRQYAFA